VSLAHLLYSFLLRGLGLGAARGLAALRSLVVKALVTDGAAIGHPVVWVSIIVWVAYDTTGSIWVVALFPDRLHQGIKVHLSQHRLIKHCIGYFTHFLTSFQDRRSARP
jgi:hypothetical protein